jgi:hypothetical protein
MKNQSIVFSVGGLLVVAGIVFFAMKSSSPSSTPLTNGVYCSPDSKLATSYCIDPIIDVTAYKATTPALYSFQIVDDQGSVVKNFQVEHEKILHLIVVSKDLAYFQHVHPDFNQTTGIFMLSDLTFPKDGQYRIFADFTATGAQMDSMGQLMNTVAHEDVSVGTIYNPQPLRTVNGSTTIDGYNVALTTDPKILTTGNNMLTYTITENGKPVTDLEDYLGALGHSVILKEGSLEYIHTHALQDVSVVQTGKIDFHVVFPSAGNYKTFTQFKHGGKVETVSFVVTVAEGAAPMMHMNMQGMDMPGMH